MPTELPALASNQLNSREATDGGCVCPKIHPVISAPARTPWNRTSLSLKTQAGAGGGG